MLQAIAFNASRLVIIRRDLLGAMTVVCLDRLRVRADRSDSGCRRHLMQRPCRRGR